jgi:shikimate kinase
LETEENLNIVLVGMMGAGKSYIGAILAKLLVHFTYVDTDDVIEKSARMSIPKIFETRGEEYFRKLESKVIKKVSLKKNQIISIGGGAFTKPDNIRALKKNSLTFYLKAPASELFNRIKNETHRPLLNNDFSLETVEGLLHKRQKYYMQADFIIDTCNMPAYVILDNIIGEYENYDKQRASC